MNLALVGATIYVSPTEPAIREGTVLIRGAKIAAVGSRTLVEPNVQTIDCSGLTIAAGFWNSHVHFFERKWSNAAAIPAPELGRQLQDAFTRYGFTTVFDLSSMWQNTRQIRDRIESGEVSGPRILSTGEGLVPKGGLPSEQILNMMGVMTIALPEISDAAQATAAAKKLLDQGVDGIKLFASAPSSAALPESAIEAAASEAHRNGKPLFAHPNNATDVLAAMRNGVDVIAHTTPRSGPWDETILATMKEREVALTPTLALWKFFMRHDRLSTQEQLVHAAIGQLRDWVSAGGTVLFGTDLGAVDSDPSDEYALMAEAGMSFPQILESLTSAPAARFGGSGRVAEGSRADLVVFGDDLADVRYTLRDGKFVWSAAAKPPLSQKAAADASAVQKIG